MWLGRCYQIKVAAVSPGIAGLSLTGDTHSRPIFNPGRNLDLKLFQTSYYPGAAADRAGDILYLAAATTARAGLLGLKAKDAAGAVVGFLQGYLNRVVHIPAAPWSRPTAGSSPSGTLKEV